MNFTFTTRRGYVTTVAPSFAKAPSKNICSKFCYISTKIVADQK